MRKSLTALVWVSLIATVFAVFMWIDGLYVDGLLNRERESLVSGAKVGWSRAQVIAHLGKPDQIARTQEEVLLYSPEEKPLLAYPVDREVLIYSEGHWYLFAYIDSRNRVTRVAMRRT
jgi:hypothetical protein